MSTTVLRHSSRIGAFFSVLFSFVKENAVLSVAAVAALVTSFFVPPDAAWLNYFDLKTLTCLFCILAVVCALKNIRFFSILARRIVQLTRATRPAILSLVIITFVGSMLIANDMALLTFLPLGYYVLTAAHKESYMAFTFIMQNIAANLGGMLTPFGNPQNLYLYTRFSISNGEFVSIMLLPFVVSVLLIVVCCRVFVRNEPLTLTGEEELLPHGRTALYLVLFVYAIAIVFRTIPYWTGLILIPTVLLFADRRALAAVDYPLLLTFVCFFVFSGNMARIDIVRNFFSALLEKNTLVVSVLCCQGISNVPTAILLSSFTSEYASLLRGVNIGGAGTLIASLASLITFRQYASHYPNKVGRYLLLFSAFNFGFVILLTILCLLFPYT